MYFVQLLKHTFYENDYLKQVFIKSNLGETWQTKIKTTIPLFKMHLLTSGAIFNILYDANDKTKVILDKKASSFQ